MDNQPSENKTAEQLEDEKNDLEMQQKRRNYKSKMKCVYISILLTLIGEKEMNMILRKPEEANELIDQEMKQYLEKLFAYDTLDYKILEITQIIQNRIDKNEPTVQSLLKADAQGANQGEKLGSLIGPTKNAKNRPLPVWKLQRMQQNGETLTQEQLDYLKTQPKLELQYPKDIRGGAQPWEPVVHQVDSMSVQPRGPQLDPDQETAAILASIGHQVPGQPAAMQGSSLTETTAFQMMLNDQLNCHQADKYTMQMIQGVRQIGGKYTVVVDPNVPNKMKVHGKIDIQLIKAHVLQNLQGNGSTVLINTANPTMNDNQGLSGEIFQNAGNKIQEEAGQWLQLFGSKYQDGKLPVGGCGITTGGNLSTSYIVHCRVPVYDEIPDNGQRDKTMTNCLRMSVYAALDTAQKIGANTVVMPPIQTIPIELCAKSLIANMIEWISVQQPSELQIIKLCISDPAAFDKFQQNFQMYAQNYSQQ